MANVNPIDPLQLIKELDPEQLGMFEPITGLMLLNVSHDEFLAQANRWYRNESTKSDVELIKTINHEAYHYAQTISSGYMYYRQLQLYEKLRRFPLKQKFVGWKRKLIWLFRNEIPYLFLKKSLGTHPETHRRLENLKLFIQRHHQLVEWHNDALPGDHSMAGVLLPHFFRYQKELSSNETKENEDGLSILGVLEGSAVVHTHLLMSKDISNSLESLESELEILPKLYSQMYELTKRYCGNRSIEFILPTTALALQYTRPHDAYLPLLKTIIASNPDDPLEGGRRLSKNLPRGKFAGKVLGTAVDVHQRSHAKYMFYLEALKALAAEEWGIDSYTLLAQPEAMHRVKCFHCGLITHDGYLGDMDKSELAMRMVIMATVLRVRSRRREERNIQKWMTNYMAERIISLLSHPLQGYYPDNEENEPLNSSKKRSVNNDKYSRKTHQE